MKKSLRIGKEGEHTVKAMGFVLAGVGGIAGGALLAFTPLINIFLGWWLAPLLVVGGVVAILEGTSIEAWEITKRSLRLLICGLFKEEEEGRPARHRKAVNEKFWRLLGGGSCRSRRT